MSPLDENRVPGSGGTQGGVGLFFLGFALAGVALYFFFDSVRVSTGHHGLLSGMMGGRGRGGGRGMAETTSMGILFLPFLISTIALFVDSKMKWAWGLLWIGIGILVIEVLSRIRFIMDMKLSHLLIMFVAFAAGAGLMIRSYREERKAVDAEVKKRVE
ncbi:MAG: hypothetical protein ACI97B_003801 [Verrucomicrobiales bacterium]|jgi:uncharacterized protein